MGRKGTASVALRPQGSIAAPASCDQTVQALAGSWWQLSPRKQPSPSRIAPCPSQPSSGTAPSPAGSKRQAGKGSGEMVSQQTGAQAMGRLGTTRVSRIAGQLDMSSCCSRQQEQQARWEQAAHLVGECAPCCACCLADFSQLEIRVTLLQLHTSKWK